MKILMLDNYDSFTYNLVHYLEACGDDIEVTVKRNDHISIDAVAEFDAIVLSPGPGLPKDAGIMPQLIMTYATQKPILGICLGHQAIGEAFDCRLENLKKVYHGLGIATHIISEDILFTHLPKTIITGRYHSWVIDKQSISKDLIITATDEQGEIMAMRHQTLPIHSVQFHPESILTEHGQSMIQNWVNTYQWQ
jgi:anthranilate synthase component II